ncbi:MAG: CoA-binding protein [Lautropia sp.]
MWTDEAAYLTRAHRSKRGVYRPEQLRRLLAPKSIAIVGASSRPGAFGATTLSNLHGYSGNVYLVNPRYDRIFEHRCYPRLSEIPEVPDCVVICVPRNRVEAIVVECAEFGVGGAVVYASGFAETGIAERIEEQSRLAAIARESSMRIVGPNVVGFANFSSQVSCTFVSIPTIAQSQCSIGVVSQSGAVGFSAIQAASHGVSFSHFLASGNSCDVDVADYISYLADESSCRAIVCMLEGISAPERLIEAGDIAWARDKPVIVFKLGTGKAGAAAALSHTGTLAGSDSTYRAAFDRCGMILAEEHEAVVEMAAFFAKARAPRGHGVAVVTNSGGLGVMLADKAEVHRVPLLPPSVPFRK